MQRRRNMTILEISQLAGVSRAAVSRYFNNGYISEEKREAIRKVVEETGYRPSLQAQMLRTKRTKMIGVIVPKIASTSIGRVVEGILSVLNENGYQMVLAVTENNPERELDYLISLDQRHVDGIILAGTVFTPEHKEQLKKLPMPITIVGQQLSGYSCVYHDDYHAAYDVTQSILKKGRKKIGYISADMQDKAAGYGRYQGFRDAVCDYGQEQLADNYVIASFSAESGYQKAEELLQSCNNDLDAIICATDTMAAGVMQYLTQQGISVPKDIMLAGHGDSDISKVIIPPIITVHFAYEKSGEKAARILLDQIANTEEAVQEVKLGYHIVDSQNI